MASRFLRHQRQSSTSRITRTSAPSVHPSHAQPLGISTGGLRPRMSFVFTEGDSGGPMRAGLLEITAMMGEGRWCVVRGA